MPVPDVIEQAPDHICVPLNCLRLRPQVAAREAREFLQVPKYLVIVSIDGGHVLRRPMQALDDLVSASQPVNQVAEENAVAAVLGQVLDELSRVDLVTDQLDIVDQPSDQLQLCLLVDRLHFDLLSLDIQRLHLLHDLVNVVDGSVPVVSPEFITTLADLLLPTLIVHVSWLPSCRTIHARRRAIVSRPLLHGTLTA